jgi:16S rRNA processing protein RimM
MIDLSDCSIVGTIAKTHGVHGQVVLRLNDLNFDEIIKMETVFLEIDGLPVPFFIAEYSEKNYDSVILSLEDVCLEEKARELVGCRVFLATNDIKPARLKELDELETLIGYDVFDLNHGRLGILKDIINVEQNPLFRIVHGKKEILVPMQPEFIHKIDKLKKQLTVDTPTGLIDLF